MSNLQAPEVGHRLAKALNVQGAVALRGVEEVIFPVIVVDTLPTATKRSRCLGYAKQGASVGNYSLIGFRTRNGTTDAAYQRHRLILRSFLLRSTAAQQVDVFLKPTLLPTNTFNTGYRLDQHGAQGFGLPIIGTDPAGTAGPVIARVASVALTSSAAFNLMLDGTVLDDVNESIVFQTIAQNLDLECIMTWEEEPTP